MIITKSHFINFNDFEINMLTGTIFLIIFSYSRTYINYSKFGYFK